MSYAILKNKYQNIWQHRQKVVYCSIIKKIRDMIQPKESKTNSHFYISIVKSIIRIIGCCFLLAGDFKSGAILLGIAEILGIAEEIF